MSNDLATVEELKRRLHTAGGGRGAADDETLLDELLDEAAARVRKAASGRTLVPTPDGELEAKTFDAYSAIVQVPDLRVVSTVTLDGRLLDAGVGYSLRTPVGDGDDRRYLRIRLRGYGAPYGGDSDYFELAGGFEPGALEIVGKWGPTEVEADVRGAVLTWAARAWHVRAARFADATQDPAGGASSYFRAVPSDVAAVLEDLQVPGL